MAEKRLLLRTFTPGPELSRCSSALVREAAGRVAANSCSTAATPQELSREQIRDLQHEAGAPQRRYKDGWRPTAVDVPAASGAHSTPTPTPSPLTISPSSRQAITLLLQPSPIELELLEEAPTSSAGWRRSLSSLAMRAARRVRHSRSGSSRRRIVTSRVAPRPRGCLGAAAVPRPAHTCCGCVGSFV